MTPLQQKEVTVRHLKTKLKESERRLHERESEIVELKSQLARMREDWIEEECHRVEAQLALKEARKEIKQLKQVIETMRSSLADKDKGIQKYFVDINIQNKKLESLLQSMEMAHSGLLRDELCLDFPVSPRRRAWPSARPWGRRRVLCPRRSRPRKKGPTASCWGQTARPPARMCWRSW